MKLRNQVDERLLTVAIGIGVGIALAIIGYLLHWISAVLDKRVDNPDYENSHHNEYPIGNLNARYRCFLAEPFHGCSPR